MKSLAGLLVALLVFVSPVSAKNFGNLCWRLEPFEDQLILNVEQPLPGQRWFILGASWLGETGGILVYSMDGAGQALARNEETIHAITLTLYNPSPFFGNNFIGNVSITLLDGLDGVWSIVTPPTAPGNQPFYQAGDLLPIMCNGTPFPGGSVASSAPGGQALAGFGSSLKK